jgi:hypothetical protein
MHNPYAIKIQAIRSKGRNDRFYVVIPMPLAAAIGLEQGEEVQWVLIDKDTLEMKRCRQAKTKKPHLAIRAKKKKISNVSR